VPVKLTDCLIRSVAVAAFIYAVIAASDTQTKTITAAVVVTLEAMSYGRAQEFIVRVGKLFRLVTRGR
jgi:hypothetical protein